MEIDGAESEARRRPSLPPPPEAVKVCGTAMENALLLLLLLRLRSGNKSGFIPPPESTWVEGFGRIEPFQLVEVPPRGARRHLAVMYFSYFMYERM